MKDDPAERAVTWIQIRLKVYYARFDVSAFEHTDQAVEF